MTTSKPTVIQTDLDILSDYSLQLNRWLLKPIGAWPSSSITTKTERVVSVILIIICYSLILITVIPCLLHIILEDEDLRTKLIVLGPLSHWSLGGIGYTMLLMHNKEIKWCVEQIKSDWQAVTRPEVQEMMIKNAKYGRYVVAICATFFQVTILVFNVINGLTEQVVQVGNETRIVRVPPVAVYKKLIPVDTSPTNDIVLVVQCISGIIVSSGFVSAFSLAAIFIAHAYGQLNILMMWISEFVDQSREHDKCDHLNDIGTIVNKHLSIMKLMVNIYILNSWQCNKVGETVYMSNWYYLPKKDVLELMFIISRSFVETKLTAGKIIHISFYTFAGVMKTAFAYLNILLQTI
uniref:uncharacterized protein LOC117600096 n=1 Tax=Osmia lignaria TaxID=473952 RepID=UPI0014796027|nr:uncharacterized protein LOC117600096 [Osmia lignaria]